MESSDQDHEHTKTATSDDEMVIQPMCSIFRRFLKNQGLKFTAERAMILDAVLSKDGLFEAEELMFEMHQAGHRVSKATIYRTLKHLVEAGIIREVLLEARQTHYELDYGRKHTDHLLNVESDEVVEFHSPELLELRDRICREQGLEPVGHRFLIYGVPRGSSGGSDDGGEDGSTAE